jgi:acetyl esterase
VSGRVRADTRNENPNAKRVEAYYGSDPSKYGSPFRGVPCRPEQCGDVIAFVEYENPLINV